MAQAFELFNQVIHLVKKLVARAVRGVGDQCQRVIRQFHFAGLTRPTPHFAIGEQGQATEVTAEEQRLAGLFERHAPVRGSEQMARVDEFDGGARRHRDRPLVPDGL